ncbi:MAG: hypothetical protein IBX56_00320, partial [Methylomicrobium sp.]|nr:hypothetical protein [Methylomicrobium sp.]
MNGPVVAVKEYKPHSILFGQTEIVYSVNACDRKTLAIHVYPDGRVIVDAPRNADQEA